MRINATIWTKVEIQNVRPWSKSDFCEYHAEVPVPVGRLRSAINSNRKIILWLWMLSCHLITECVELELTTAVPWRKIPVALNGIEREQPAFWLAQVATVAEKVQFPAEYPINGLAAGTACKRR
jgi:hypothetical protein